MPLVKLDMIKGQRSPEEIRKLADVVQDTFLNSFNAPKGDRYQIITQHEPYEMICEDTGLGIQRSDKLLFIQIFEQGRGKELKEQIYAALAENLKKECGLEGSDLIISVSMNNQEDWSFGFGRAQVSVQYSEEQETWTNALHTQFLTGELPIKK